MKNKEYSLLYDCVKQSANLYGNKIAYEYIGSNTKYDCFLYKIDCAAIALNNIGIKEDDADCIATPNIPQAIIMIHAVNKIGANQSNQIASGSVI